jgi:hypothetical protein
MARASNVWLVAMHDEFPAWAQTSDYRLDALPHDPLLARVTRLVPVTATRGPASVPATTSTR